jgi:hypothetical protein
MGLFDGLRSLLRGHVHSVACPLCNNWHDWDEGCRYCGGIGTVFHAVCPKCKKVVKWIDCPNCGGSRFNLDTKYGNFHCTNCQKGYGSLTCECGCQITGKFFRRIS